MSLQSFGNAHKLIASLEAGKDKPFAIAISAVLEMDDTEALEITFGVIGIAMVLVCQGFQLVTSVDYNCIAGDGTAGPDMVSENLNPPQAHNQHREAELLGEETVKDNGMEESLSEPFESTNDKESIQMQARHATEIEANGNHINEHQAVAPTQGLGRLIWATLQLQSIRGMKFRGDEEAGFRDNEAHNALPLHMLFSLYNRTRTMLSATFVGRKQWPNLGLSRSGVD
uniref:Uncharacterized protein n=1 Tax=Leersia perrieri TaxID=77586 RepID=A0A0D9V540_9ORYZ